MAKVKLKKEEQNMIFNALKVRLASEKAKLEHYERLNTYSDSKMPDVVMEVLRKDIRIIQDILPKLDENFSHDGDIL